MVSVCLPSDTLLQHLPSYLGFSYLGRGVSISPRCSSKAQPMLLTLDEGYLFTATLLDPQRGIAPLGPSVPVQPWNGVGSPGHRPWPPEWGCSSLPPPLASGVGVWSSSFRPPPLASGLRVWGISSRRPPLTSDAGYLLSATPPDLGHGVAPLGHSCTVAAWHSRLLPLTSDMG